MLAQRRHMNIEDVEAVIKILAKFSVGHGFVGNLVGGGQHAHVDRSFDLAAEPAQFVVFQNAQKLGLRADRHLADFIEQQRAPFGEFETAGAAFERAR